MGVTCSCGRTMTGSDPAVEIIGGRIVCPRCARRAGVDTGAFARPLKEIQS